MFHHPCFTALISLGYQALLPANFEMNVVVSLTGVVTCSSSAEAVWTGLPGPWVDLSTFLKLALVLLAVLIWQLASLLVCPFPFPKLALPCPLPQQCLLCVHFCFFLWACPPSPRWSLSRLDLNPHAQSRNFFTMPMRYSPYKSACAVTIFFKQCACVFHRRMDVACVHTRTRSHSSWLKLKVLVTKGVLGFARGLTSSDALICCQVLVLVDDESVIDDDDDEVALRFSTVQWYCDELPSMCLSGSFTTPPQQSYFLW